MTSIAGARKKRGRPPVGSTSLNVRMPPDELALLDRFITEQQPDMSRPEALRYAFRDWAIGQGLFHNREDPEGAN